MATFLNTQSLNYWTPKLIEEAENELVLIVPYIQISKTIMTALKKADEKDTEIVLIYRENKLDERERKKLLSLKNINLLHHPNIHCKAYYNGSLLIIGSMNLYEHSERNNREMGTLFTDEDLEDDNYEDRIESDQEEIFYDFIEETIAIINGANLEQASNKQKEKSFEIDILKTNEELEIERCNRINSYFLNKKFKVQEIRKNLYYSVCENYFDKVDVCYQHNRIAIRFDLQEEELKNIYKLWMKDYKEFEFQGFKYYWNYFASDLLLYRDYKFDWNSLDENPKLMYKKTINGLDKIIKKYRKLTNK